ELARACAMASVETQPGSCWFLGECGISGGPGALASHHIACSTISQHQPTTRIMSDLMTNGVSSEGPSTSFWQRVTLKQVAGGTVVAALLLTAIVLLVALRYVFLLLFLSIVVATALAPLTERLRRCGLSHTLAALIAFALLVGVMAAIVAAIAPFF